MVKRVLIVDDSELQRMMLRHALEDFPCEVAGEAADGTEAVRQTTALRPDVVLLDMDMPGMCGLDALKAIKAARPETVVLMVTAIDSTGVMDDCLLAGAEDYIRKDRLESLGERAGSFLL